VRSQVLEGLEPRARRADIDVTIERAYRPAQGEVAGRPRTRTTEMPGEEPVRGPLAIRNQPERYETASRRPVVPERTIVSQTSEAR
jgi:hypothetical protein